MWWPQVTGCATCRWVKPGITSAAPASACADQRPHQRRQPLDRRVALAAHPEPEVGRHLVVARPRGVQPPGRRADQLRSRLSTFMWMSSSAVENGEAAGLDL